MIEASVAAGIALFTAIVSVHNRLHTKISEVDSRVDTAELSMARHYVYKEDFEKAFQKMEGHMSRIEEKLDQMIMRNG